jgi:uncharacterized protein YbaR (Trm112 family)
MKGFLKFLLFVGFVAGVVYAVQKMLSQPARQGAGAGVLPETPVTPLEDAPLGGEISPQLLEILVDPEDKGALELVDEGKSAKRLPLPDPQRHPRDVDRRGQKISGQEPHRQQWQRAEERNHGNRWLK